MEDSYFLRLPLILIDNQPSVGRPHGAGKTTYRKCPGLFNTLVWIFPTGCVIVTVARKNGRGICIYGKMDKHVGNTVLPLACGVCTASSR